MKRLPILIFFLSRGFAADAVKMFPLKYADSEQLRKLFSSYAYAMSVNRDLNVLTVTAPASFLAEVEAAVKQFDIAPVPPKNIELTVAASFLLKGFTLTIQRGEIQEIRTGSCEVEGTLECLGVEVKKKPARFDLPGAIPVSNDARARD